MAVKEETNTPPPTTAHPTHSVFVCDAAVVRCGLAHAPEPALRRHRIRRHQLRPVVAGWMAVSDGVGWVGGLSCLALSSRSRSIDRSSPPSHLGSARLAVSVVILTTRRVYTWWSWNCTAVGQQGGPKQRHRASATRPPTTTQRTSIPTHTHHIVVAEDLAHAAALFAVVLAALALGALLSLLQLWQRP